MDNDRRLHRFLVFMGSNSDPYGGWEDYQKSFPSKEEAAAFIGRTLSSDDWAEVVDGWTGEVVVDR
jgi:hypothetical protein